MKNNINYANLGNKEDSVDIEKKIEALDATFEILKEDEENALKMRKKVEDYISVLGVLESINNYLSHNY